MGRIISHGLSILLGFDIQNHRLNSFLIDSFLVIFYELFHYKLKISMERSIKKRKRILTL
jgi:hypothetical protein